MFKEPKKETQDYIVQKSFIPKINTAQLFQNLEENSPWKQHTVKLFGKEIPEPRTSAYYSTNGKPYVYSGLKLQALEPTELIKGLIELVSAYCDEEFNTCFLNRYANGEQYMGWHRDNEPTLGKNPMIASLNFGASRDFQFREFSNKENKETLLLESGDLFIMKPGFQEKYEHQVPKRMRQNGVRINLTFRDIIGS